MKWMVAVCTLVASGALAQMEGSPPGATAYSQPQPPADLLPRVEEGSAPPVTAKSKIGVSSPARKHRRPWYPRSGARVGSSSGHGKAQRPARHFLIGTPSRPLWRRRRPTPPAS